MKFSGSFIKNISRTVVVLSLIVANFFSAFSQCPVTAFASPLTINCGQGVTLSAFGTPGFYIFTQDFNSGCPGSNWFASSSADCSNPCGNGPGGSTDPHLWMSSTSTAPRNVTTNNYNLTTGGTVCFDMRYAEEEPQEGCGAVSISTCNCEGPDLPDEGVHLQYSTDNGTTWVDIQYWDPNGGHDSLLVNWNRHCVNIPAGAMTANTQFRWYQIASSNQGSDHWGLDNITIATNDPSYLFDWTHDGLSPAITATTPQVFPTSNTTYTVNYSDGATTCSSNVTVIVALPTVTTTTSPTTICYGSSSQLIANSSLVATPPSACGINTYGGCPPNSQAGEPQIGNGSTVATYNSSANYVFGDFGSTGGVRTQIIYRASELIAAGFSAGQITNMQLEVGAIQVGSGLPPDSVFYRDFAIQFKCISASQFSSSSNWQSGLTTVFPATNVTVTTGWNTFNFPNSYNWDGTSNIVVQLCWYNGSAGSGSPLAKTKTQAAGFNSMIASYVNASGAALNCASHTSFQTLYTFRPNTRFGTCTPTNIPLVYSWTPTTGLSNSNIYNPVATPSTTTTYTVSVQQSGAPVACAATSNITVNVVAPSVSISSSCAAGTATLTANGTTNGTVPSGTITNSNSSAQANYNVNTYVEKCIDVSNINPNTYPAGLTNVFVNITHCDITEVDLQIMGPGGAWTTLTALTSGGKTWTTLPAGAATSINGQWCIRYKDNCVGCGALGTSDCGGLTFNSWSITLNNAAGSNQIVEYTWSPPTDLNTTTGSVVQSASTSSITYTVTVKDAFGCTTNQSIMVDASNCFVLPIKLISFNAALVQKNIELIWITETEINNDYFTIERSTDLEQWELVKKVNGAGNSNTTISYVAVDQNPFFGISYYRLKQTDFNGVFTYSKAVIIDNKELDDILVYPNPIKDALTIKTTCDNCNIKIYSALGQLVYNGNEKKINTSNWAKGVYEVVVINNDGSFFNTKVFK